MLIQSCGCSLHMGGKNQRKARSYVDHQGKQKHVFTKLQYWLKLRIILTPNNIGPWMISKGKHTHVFTKLLSEQYWLKLRINSYFPVSK